MRSSSPGKVYLVGAGPGDPELITVRGLRCLRRADVVIHDRLVHPALVDEAPRSAERIFVGKEPGFHLIRQEEINALMIDRARAGLTIARLKGGDPFIFARGGEEAAALQAAGIPWEVVPGITSAIGVPGSASIPLTHRALAASFAVVTAHQCPERRTEVDWRALAKVDTLVVLMGVDTLKNTVRSLLRCGRDPATPVAVIQEGTMPGEQVVTGTLADIAARARRAGVRPPATTVIGEVVHLRETLRTSAGEAGEPGITAVQLPYSPEPLFASVLQSEPQDPRRRT